MNTQIIALLIGGLLFGVIFLFTNHQGTPLTASNNFAVSKGRFQVTFDASSGLLSLEGVFPPSDVAQLERISWRDVRQVRVNSYGGDFLTAKSLANLLLIYGLTIEIPAGGTCSDTCVLLLAGAKTSLAAPDVTLFMSGVKTPQGKVLLQTNTEMVQFFHKLGVNDPRITTALSLAEPTWFSASEAYDMRLIDQWTK